MGSRADRRSCTASDSPTARVPSGTLNAMLATSSRRIMRSTSSNRAPPGGAGGGGGPGGGDVGGATGGGGGSEPVIVASENEASTPASPDRVRSQVESLLVQSPLQPSKSDPSAGIAVSVTVAPAAKEAEQVGGYWIPDGLLVTWPPPVTSTVSVLNTVSVVTSSVVALQGGPASRRGSARPSRASNRCAPDRRRGGDRRREDRRAARPPHADSRLVRAPPGASSERAPLRRLLEVRVQPQARDVSFR
jgi:hypothetical protein